MLTLTHDAAEVIRDLTAQAHYGRGGLRIATRAMDDGSRGLEAGIVEAPSDEDIVVAVDDARVFLEPLVAIALERKVLDTQPEADDGGQVSFLIAEQPPGGPDLNGSIEG